MSQPTHQPTGPCEPAANHLTLRVVVSDGRTITVYRLPADALSDMLPQLAPPEPPELLSRRLIGHAERTPDGWVVNSPTDDAVRYPMADRCRAICSALAFSADE